MVRIMTSNSGKIVITGRCIGYAIEFMDCSFGLVPLLRSISMRYHVNTHSYTISATTFHTNTHSYH